MEDNYMQRVRERFYKQVKETNWGVTEERICKRRGRRPQERIIAEQKFRPKQEHKFFNFN
jgi:hypothetical protein